ncbi:MAG: universal stress protein [Gammaproteobacteria bacterium]|nr:universal stress protein [Gammaproteobacteria bacterium]
MVIPDIKTILYPTDLSRHGKKVFSYSEVIAAALGAQIVVLHVVEPLSKQASAVIDGILPSGIDDTGTMHRKGVEALKETIEEEVRGYCIELLGDSSKFDALIKTVEVIDGLCAQVILDRAGKHDADLIVMGTHGHSAFSDMLLGSVAHKVVHRASVPVTLVPFKS